MRRVFLVFLPTLLLLSACVNTKLSITPYPTAVPPADGEFSGRIYGITFEYPLPEGYLADGELRYRFEVDCTSVGQELVLSEWSEVDISAEKGTNAEQTLYIRIEGVSQYPVLASFINEWDLHPDQKTVAAVSLGGMTEENAQIGMETCSANLQMGEEETYQMNAVEIFVP